MRDNYKLPSEEIQNDLKAILDFCTEEDTAVRERQIRQWRQLKFYWDGLVNIWWSTTAHDWRIYDQQVSGQSYNDGAYYDKRINVLRPYLESIFAALSVTVPPVKCIPADADNPLDLATAKAGDKISLLLYKQIEAKLKWLHSLFIYGTEGLVAAYNYCEESEDYGTYEEEVYEDEEIEKFVCPQCGTELEDDIFSLDPMMDTGMGETIPMPPICPNCEAPIDPALEKQKITTKKLVDTVKKPRSRVKVEMYGGLSVKVPNYARNQSECPYLIYAYETNYISARAKYPHLIEKNLNAIGPGSAGGYDPYERWGRNSTQYMGEIPKNVVTCRYVWLRPETYYYLSDKVSIERLEKEYPLGCKVVMVNEEFAEVCEEKLDDHWTLTKNPLSDHVHYQPLGMLLVTVQDLTNELLSLTTATIEHGIPQTFADPGVLNFDAYRQVETAPGSIFPATPKAGRAIGEAFYEIKTATLSQEVFTFGEQIQQLGQMSSGALPSLFGGAQPNSSKTASQYITSKNQAMQRLQTTWTMLCTFWKDIFTKAIPAHMNEMVDDEKFVTMDRQGAFTNVFIRKAETEGKIGEIELEASEEMPMSWMQKRDAIMQFLEAANPVVMEALIDPNNLPLLQEMLGLSELELPGSNDREVQLEEIKQLINSIPIPMMPAMPPMMEGLPDEGMGGGEMQDPAAMGQMMPQEQASVSIEPDLDNHPVHIQICKNWLTGEAGRQAKIDNVEGYMNVLLHMKMHIQFVQMQQAMMQASQQQEEGAPATGKPQNDKMKAPNKGQLHESTV